MFSSGTSAAIHALSPAEARDLLVRLQSGTTAKPPARIEDMTFPVGRTGSVSMRELRRFGLERLRQRAEQLDKRRTESSHACSIHSSAANAAPAKSMPTISAERLPRSGAFVSIVTRLRP